MPAHVTHEAAAAENTSVHHTLLEQRTYTSPHLRIEMVQPTGMEPLADRRRRFAFENRVFVAGGMLEPSAVGTSRDFAEVRVRCGGEEDGWERLRLPAFLAHLVNPASLRDADAPPWLPGAAAAMSAQGTWSGSLIWDSAVRAAELLLGDWRARVAGCSVLELGCGLALPGLVAHLLGARSRRGTLARSLSTCRRQHWLSHVCA